MLESDPKHLNRPQIGEFPMPKWVYHPMGKPWNHAPNKWPIRGLFVLVTSISLVYYGYYKSFEFTEYYPSTGYEREQALKRKHFRGWLTNSMVPFHMAGPYEGKIVNNHIDYGSARIVTGFY